MFSKANRFESSVTANKVDNNGLKKIEFKTQESNKRNALPLSKAKNVNIRIPTRNIDIKTSSTPTIAQCSSAQKPKSLLTPKPSQLAKPSTTKDPSVLQKIPLNKKIKSSPKAKVVKDATVTQKEELRHTRLQEHDKIIEVLKREIAQLQSKLNRHNNSEQECKNLSEKISQISISDSNSKQKPTSEEVHNYCKEIKDLNRQILLLEQQSKNLQYELCAKQVEMSSLEKIIEIRDSLCKDLQDKLTDMEKCLNETYERLDMVKGHHSLALEANESIRKEYKIETEKLKAKLEEDKQALINKSKLEQETLKVRYENFIESLRKDINKEKEDVTAELKQIIKDKELEMNAKLEQMEEATREKLRLCEIQFEERSRDAEQLWLRQCEEMHHIEQEIEQLRNKLKLTEEQNDALHKEINYLKNKNVCLLDEKASLLKQITELKDEPKTKIVDCENEINRLTVELDKAIKEKTKFETSLMVTRDIVNVLTIRLRESDNEIDCLEDKFHALNNVKQNMEEELINCKIALNNTVLECSEFREALTNILKSKAALTKEHNRIMEHNVSLIESLQNVEKEAYRELGTIKNELIEDVELLKKESSTQIQILREEVEKKRRLCELATEHAGQATAAAEQSRGLLARAAQEISRLETDNQRLQQQIEDQQSMVVEISLLRQENEELSLNVAKQASIIEKMKKEMESKHSHTKSPSVYRKVQKVGKENTQNVISPLRERNH